MLQKIFEDATDKQYFFDDLKMCWLHGTLLCKKLGFANPSAAIQLHTDEDERQRVDLNGKSTWFVSEPGVWGLILAAKTPQALDFKRELKHVILPKLRADRFYIAPNATQQDLIKAQQQIQVLRLQQRDILLGNCSDRVSIRDFIKAIALKFKPAPDLLEDKSKVPVQKDLIQSFSSNIYEWQVDFSSDIQEMFDQYDLGLTRPTLLFTSPKSALYFADQKYPAWILAYFLVNNFLQNKLFAKYPKHWSFSFNEELVDSLIPKLG